MVRIEVSENERKIIDTIRLIERAAYEDGFKNGEAEGTKKMEEAVAMASADGFKRGKAAGYRAVRIDRIAEEFDRATWVPGDQPEKEGEYLVTAEGFSSPIALNFADGKWQAPKKNPPKIIAFKKMPAAYKED